MAQDGYKNAGYCILALKDPLCQLNSSSLGFPHCSVPYNLGSESLSPSVLSGKEANQGRSMVQNDLEREAG